MSMEVHETIAVVRPPELTRPEPPLERSAAELPARTQEEIRATEAVFAQQSQEAAKVAGLWNVWAGAMIIRDILEDTFAKPAEEEEEQLKEKNTAE